MGKAGGEILITMGLFYFIFGVCTHTHTHTQAVEIGKEGGEFLMTVFFCFLHTHTGCGDRQGGRRVSDNC